MLTLRLGSPLSSTGIAGPLTMTVRMIRTMLMSAIALALLRLSIDRYKESGYEMVKTQKIIRNAREDKKVPSRLGRTEVSTCGIVSPITTWQGTRCI